MAPDKIKHFAVGLAISVIVFTFAWWQGFSILAALSFAAVAVLIAACAKEIYDSRHPDKHTADWWDIWATLAGWLPLALTVYLS